MFYRKFLSLAAIIVTTVILSCNNQSIDETVFEAGEDPYLSKQGEDLYMVENLNNGGNICFLVSKKGVLIVDAGYYPSGSEKVVELIQRVTDRPVRYVVFTHCHTDHVGGIAGYPDDITIIGHANLPANIDNFVLPGIEAFKKDLEQFGEDSLRLRYGEIFDDIAGMKIRKPDLLFDETHSINLGDYTVDLSYPGTCHTTDNIYVLFREQKVLHTGDLVFNNRHPFVSSAYSADPVKWGESVREWSKEDLAVVIPGHGDVGGVEILVAQADYFDKLIEAVSGYRDSELSLSEIALEIGKEYFPGFETAGYFISAVELLLNRQ